MPGEQHRKAVDPNTQARSRWHAVFKGTQEIVVHGHGFIVAFLCQLQLFFEALELIDRIVQLGISIGNFLPVYIEFKTLNQPGFFTVFLGERA